MSNSSYCTQRDTKLLESLGIDPSQLLLPPTTTRRRVIMSKQHGKGVEHVPGLADENIVTRKNSLLQPTESSTLKDRRQSMKQEKEQEQDPPVVVKPKRTQMHRPRQLKANLVMHAGIADEEQQTTTSSSSPVRKSPEIKSLTPQKSAPLTRTSSTVNPLKIMKTTHALKCDESVQTLLQLLENVDAIYGDTSVYDALASETQVEDMISVMNEMMRRHEDLVKNAQSVHDTYAPSSVIDPDTDESIQEASTLLITAPAFGLPFLYRKDEDRHLKESTARIIHRKKLMASFVPPPETDFTELARIENERFLSEFENRIHQEAEEERREAKLKRLQLLAQEQLRQRGMYSKKNNVNSDGDDSGSEEYSDDGSIQGDDGAVNAMQEELTLNTFEEKATMVMGRWDTNEWYQLWQQEPSSMLYVSLFVKKIVARKVFDYSGQALRCDREGFVVHFAKVSSALRFAVNVQTEFLKISLPLQLQKYPCFRDLKTNTGTTVLTGPRIAMSIHIGKLERIPGFDRLVPTGSDALVLESLCMIARGGEVLGLPLLLGPSEYVPNGVTFKEMTVFPPNGPGHLAAYAKKHKDRICINVLQIFPSDGAEGRSAVLGAHPLTEQPAANPSNTSRGRKMAIQYNNPKLPSHLTPPPSAQQPTRRRSALNIPKKLNPPVIWGSEVLSDEVRAFSTIAIVSVSNLKELRMMPQRDDIFKEYARIVNSLAKHYGDMSVTVVTLHPVETVLAFYSEIAACEFLLELQKELEKGVWPEGVLLPYKSPEIPGVRISAGVQFDPLGVQIEKNETGLGFVTGYTVDWARVLSCFAGVGEILISKHVHKTTLVRLLELNAEVVAITEARHEDQITYAVYPKGRVFGNQSWDYEKLKLKLKDVAKPPATIKKAVTNFAAMRAAVRGLNFHSEEQDSPSTTKESELDVLRVAPLDVDALLQPSESEAAITPMANDLTSPEIIVAAPPPEDNNNNINTLPIPLVYISTHVPSATTENSLNSTSEDGSCVLRSPIPRVSTMQPRKQGSQGQNGLMSMKRRSLGSRLGESTVSEIDESGTLLSPSGEPSPVNGTRTHTPMEITSTRPQTPTSENAAVSLVPVLDENNDNTNNNTNVGNDSFVLEGDLRGDPLNEKEGDEDESTAEKPKQVRRKSRSRSQSVKVSTTTAEQKPNTEQRQRRKSSVSSTPQVVRSRRTSSVTSVDKESQRKTSVTKTTEQPTRKQSGSVSMTRQNSDSNSDTQKVSLSQNASNSVSAVSLKDASGTKGGTTTRRKTVYFADHNEKTLPDATPKETTQQAANANETSEPPTTTTQMDGGLSTVIQLLPEDVLKMIQEATESNLDDDGNHREDELTKIIPPASICHDEEHRAIDNSVLTVQALPLEPELLPRFNQDVNNDKEESDGVMFHLASPPLLKLDTTLKDQQDLVAMDSLAEPLHSNSEPAAVVLPDDTFIGPLDWREQFIRDLQNTGCTIEDLEKILATSEGKTSKEKDMKLLVARLASNKRMQERKKKKVVVEEGGDASSKASQGEVLRAARMEQSQAAMSVSRMNITEISFSLQKDGNNNKQNTSSGSVKATSNVEDELFDESALAKAQHNAKQLELHEEFKERLMQQSIPKLPTISTFGAASNGPNHQHEVLVENEVTLYNQLDNKHRTFHPKMKSRRGGKGAGAPKQVKTTEGGESTGFLPNLFIPLPVQNHVVHIDRKPRTPVAPQISKVTQRRQIAKQQMQQKASAMLQPNKEDVDVTLPFLFTPDTYSQLVQQLTKCIRIWETSSLWHQRRRQFYTIKKQLLPQLIHCININSTTSTSLVEGVNACEEALTALNSAYVTMRWKLSIDSVLDVLEDRQAANRFHAAALAVTIDVKLLRVCKSLLALFDDESGNHTNNNNNDVLTNDDHQSPLPIRPRPPQRPTATRDVGELLRHKFDQNQRIEGSNFEGFSSPSPPPPPPHRQAALSHSPLPEIDRSRPPPRQNASMPYDEWVRYLNRAVQDHRTKMFYPDLHKKTRPLPFECHSTTN